MDFHTKNLTGPQQQPQRPMMNDPGMPLAMYPNMQQPGLFGSAFTAEMKSARDYFIWSAFSFNFMNACCLGFAALIFSVKSRDNLILGDTEAARRHGKTAKKLNIAATASTCVFLLFSFVVVGLSVVGIKRILRNFYRN